MSRKNNNGEGLLFLGFLFIVAVIFFIVTWIVQNWIVVVSLIVIIAGVYFFINYQNEKHDREQKIRLNAIREKLAAENEKRKKEENIRLKEEMEKFEAEQKDTGLIKFSDRNNNIKWGTCEEIEKWKKEDEESEIKELLINRIVQSIQKYQPMKKWYNEDSYHKELLGY
jgi:c-di-AMP phosphodiesterase-like protein